MFLSQLRQVISRQVVALCVIVFLADVIAGIMLPTLSIYARDLGISLVVLGFLNTAGGLTQLLTSLPVGIISDRTGRPVIVMIGLATLAVSLAALAFASDASLLFVGRILFSLAAVATFQVGAAHLADVTPDGQRALAFGLFTTTQGFGFTVGPIIGGQIAQRFGTDDAYLVAAGIAVGSLPVALWMYRSWPRRRSTAVTRPSMLSGVQQVMSRLDLVLVTFGNSLVSLVFSGAVSTFFPLYGQSVIISQATIGSMFAMRSFASTVSRFPAGVVARTLGSQRVLLTALAMIASSMLLIARTENPVLLTALLTVEGVAYGAYLVAGQTYVAENTAAESRGAAIGFYFMASSLGGTIAPFALGFVADTWSVGTVFTVTGWIVAIGVLISLFGMVGFRRAPAVRPANEGVESERPRPTG